MSTTTVTKSKRASKAQAAAQTAPQSAIAAANEPEPVNLVELRAAIFAALGKVAEGEGDRDELTDGSAHNFNLMIGGEVDGYQFNQAFAGGLTVGHASDRASSVGPDQDHLLAYVLGKLNAATREAIYRDTAAEYAIAGELPEMPEAAVKAAKDFRAGLRQKVSQHVRGSVRVEYAAQMSEGATTLQISKVG